MSLQYHRKEVNADVGKRGLWIYLIMYMEDSENISDLPAVINL